MAFRYDTKPEMGISNLGKLASGDFNRLFSQINFLLILVFHLSLA